MSRVICKRAPPARVDRAAVELAWRSCWRLRVEWPRLDSFLPWLGELRLADVHNMPGDEAGRLLEHLSAWLTLPAPRPGFAAHVLAAAPDLAGRCFTRAELAAAAVVVVQTGSRAAGPGTTSTTFSV